MINAVPTTLSISDHTEVMKTIDSTIGIEQTEFTTQENVLSTQNGKQAAVGRATNDSDSSNTARAYSGGMIAGIVCGVISGICLCCCCLFCLARAGS